MKIEIYTDGACSGNPGRGGFGVLLRIPEKNYQKTFAEGYRLTTNNRMELAAVIFALQKLKAPQTDVELYTDSKYVADAVNENWLHGWKRNGFKKVRNPDLWQKLVPLLKIHSVKFIWIKGHFGHKENEIVDKLATEACQKADLKTDGVFENQKKENGIF